MSFDKKAYAKEWRENNKEKIRAYAKSFYAEKRKDPEFRAEEFRKKKHRIETRIESFVSQTMTSARSRAKKHGYDFNIDSKYVTKLILQSNGECQATGLPMSTTYHCPFKASLDRIDSNKGYVKGNVRVVITMFNYMKQDYTDSQFALVAKAFAKKNNGLQKTRK